MEVPRKPISILQMQSSEFKKMSRMKLLEILMRRLNPDIGKSVVIDVESDDEIDETYDAMAKENLQRDGCGYGRLTTTAELTPSSKSIKDKLTKVWG